jgi:hypothetical protein
MEKRKYRTYTDDQIRIESSKVTSMAQLLKALGLRGVGGNYDNMRKHLQRLNLLCEHWRGQAWNKNQQLKPWSEYSKVSALKPHLIQKRGHRCEKCGLSEWNEKPIPLEVEHINGNRTDNTEQNLLILCCNCHAQTETWRGRKNRGL